MSRLSPTHALRLSFHNRFAVLLAGFLVGFGPLALWGVPLYLRNLLVLEHPIPLFHLTWVCCLAGTLTLAIWRTTVFNLPYRYREWSDWGRRADLAGDLNDDGDTCGKEILARARSRGQECWLQWGVGSWCAWLVLGLSLPASTLYASRLGDTTSGDPVTVTAGCGLLAIAAGVVLAMLFLLVLAQLSRIVPAPEILPKLLPFRVRSFHEGGESRPREAPPRKHSTTGYRYTVFGYRRWLPGHVQLVLTTLVLWVAYFASYFYYRSYQVDLRSLSEMSLSERLLADFPTAFFLVQIAMAGTSLLAGAAFFLDYYRVPPLAVAILVAWLSFSYPGKAHHYELLPAQPSADLQLPEQDDLSSGYTMQQKRMEKSPRAPDRDRTFVLVTAPGGGIHAAAWASQVLTGLDERYGDPYRDSLGVISAVSGGSVGAMHYVAWVDELREHDKHDAECYRQLLTKIRADAMEDGLRAVAWGMAFPDMMRSFIPMPIPGSHAREDRGYYLERTWRRRLVRCSLSECPESPEVERDPPTIRGWRRDVEAGRRPILVFNATFVQTGQRYLISPWLGGALAEDVPEGALAVEFLDHAKGLDLGVDCAARLSATFPYVSPVAHAHLPGAYALEQGSGLAFLCTNHVADGGYVDNEGILTVVDWTKRMLSQAEGQSPEERRFDRVLILRIEPSRPSAELLAETLETSTGFHGSGFQFVAFGPLQTVLSVRQTSQAERGELELSLLEERAAAAREASRNQAIEYAASLERVLQRAVAMREAALMTTATDDDEFEGVRIEIFQELSAADTLRPEQLPAEELAELPGVRPDEPVIGSELDETIASLRMKLAEVRALIDDPVEIDLQSVSFPFHPPAEETPPVSWKLSPAEKEWYTRAWQELVDQADRGEGPLARIERELGWFQAEE